MKKNTIWTRPSGLRVRTSNISSLQIILGYVFCWPLQFELINNVVEICYNTSWWTPTARCIWYYRPLGRLELVNHLKQHETMNDVKDNNVNLQIMFALRCSSPPVSSSILVVHDVDIVRRDCKWGPSVFTSYHRFIMDIYNKDLSQNMI